MQEIREQPTSEMKPTSPMVSTISILQEKYNNTTELSKFDLENIDDVEVADN